MRQVNPAAVMLVLLLGLWVASAAPAFVSPTSEDGLCLPDHTQATIHQEVAIPDDHPAGVKLGPLCATVSGRLEDVALVISVSHSYTGDLTFALEYDGDRDGKPDARSPVEIYLARGDLCNGTEAWSCPIELRGSYCFRDGGWKAAGESASFDVFKGLRGGGDWYLTIVDSAPGNTGTITDWSVYAHTTTMAHNDLQP